MQFLRHVCDGLDLMDVLTLLTGFTNSTYANMALASQTRAAQVFGDLETPLETIMKNAGWIQMAGIRIFCVALAWLSILPVSAEVIKIGGTGSAVGTMALLGNAFEKANPGHTVKIVPALGSSGGIKALQAGALQVAVANRDVSPEEKATNLVGIRYGTTPFVFVTHAKVPAAGLSRQDLARIYSAQQTIWPNGQMIRLVLRPVNDADTRTLMALSNEMQEAVAASYKRDGLVLALTDEDAADQIERTAGALGASTLALVLSEGRNLNVLPLEGVKPSLASLQDGSYRLSKDVYAITASAPTEGVKQFMQFLRSAPAVEILKKNGHKVY